MLCLKNKKKTNNKKKNEKNIEINRIPEKQDTYNNRLFNNTIYNIDL